MIHFGEWDDDIHDNEEQEWRIINASKEKTTPDFVDIENQMAYFQGSGKKPYETTLGKCSCGDFIHRRLPCKHIYRLAMELGLLNYEFQRGRNKNSILQYIGNLTPEAKKLLHDLLKNNGEIVTVSTKAEELIINGFCYENIHDEIKSKRIKHLCIMPDIFEIEFDLLKMLRAEIRKEDNDGTPDDT